MTQKEAFNKSLYWANISGSSAMSVFVAEMDKHGFKVSINPKKTKPFKGPSQELLGVMTKLSYR